MLTFILIWLVFCFAFLALWNGWKLARAREQLRSARLDNVCLQASNRQLRHALTKTPIVLNMRGVDQSFHPVDLVTVGDRPAPVWRN